MIKVEAKQLNLIITDTTNVRLLFLSQSWKHLSKLILNLAKTYLKAIIIMVTDYSVRNKFKHISRGLMYYDKFDLLWSGQSLLQPEIAVGTMEN